MNIENRLAKLERENWTWRFVAISLVGILGLSIACTGQWNEPATGLGSQTPAQASEQAPIQDSIRVRRLEIVDENGQTVGRWSSAGRSVSLSMAAWNDQVRISPHFVTLNAGDSQISLMPRMVTINHIGPKQQQAKARLKEDGLSVTEVERLIEQSVGDRRVALIGGEMGGGLEIYNSSDGTAAALQSTKLGGGLLDIYNRSGKTVVTLQSDKTNQGFLTISDVAGKPVHMLNERGAILRQVRR